MITLHTFYVQIQYVKFLWSVAMTQRFDLAADPIWNVTGVHLSTPLGWHSHSQDRCIASFRQDFLAFELGVSENYKFLSFF